MTDPVAEFILPIEWAGVDLTHSPMGLVSRDRDAFPELREYGQGGLLVSLKGEAARHFPGWLLSLGSQLDCVQSTPGASISVPLPEMLRHIGLTVISATDGRGLAPSLQPVAVSEAGRSGIPRATFPLGKGVALVPRSSTLLLASELELNGLSVRSWSQAAALPEELGPRVEVLPGGMAGYTFRIRLAVRDSRGLVLVFQSSAFDLRGMQAVSAASTGGHTTSGPSVSTEPLTPAMLLEEATRPNPDGHPLTATQVETRLAEAARRQHASQDILRRAQLILYEAFTPRRQLEPGFRETLMQHLPASRRTTSGPPAGHVQNQEFVTPAGRSFPIDPDGVKNAPSYGNPPPEAARRGENCGNCHFWIKAEGGVTGYCTAWAFMAARTAWCETWDS